MAFFEDLAGGFVVLMLASLILLAAGFMFDSVSTGKGIDEPAPSTKFSVFLNFGAWLLLAAGWIYMLVGEYSDHARDWSWIAIAALWSLVALLNAGRQLRTLRAGL